MLDEIFLFFPTICFSWHFHCWVLSFLCERKYICFRVFCFILVLSAKKKFPKFRGKIITTTRNLFLREIIKPGYKIIKGTSLQAELPVAFVLPSWPAKLGKNHTKQTKRKFVRNVGSSLPIWRVTSFFSCSFFIWPKVWTILMPYHLFVYQFCCWFYIFIFIVKISGA